MCIKVDVLNVTFFKEKLMSASVKMSTNKQKLVLNSMSATIACAPVLHSSKNSFKVANPKQEFRLQ